MITGQRRHTGMAQNTQEGTGKHPHKSASDPHEHHEASTNKGKHESTAKSESHSDSGSKTQHADSNSDSSDLKSREYKDKDGNIHHHTHTVGNKASEK